MLMRLGHCSKCWVEYAENRESHSLEQQQQEHTAQDDCNGRLVIEQG